MILVPLLNPKFATVPAEKSCELRVRGTSRSYFQPVIGHFSAAVAEADGHTGT